MSKRQNGQIKVNPAKLSYQMGHPVVSPFVGKFKLIVYLAGNIQDPTMTDEAIQSHYGHRSVMATVVRGGETKEYKLKDLAPAEKLEKFVEDVRFGIYPITNFGLLSRWVLG